MSPIRVLIVEDSATVRERLLEVVRGDPAFEVAGVAADGRQAIDRCRELRPDVVTMDMMLPVMTGLAATEYIMAHCPTPILVVSSSFNRGEVFRTYEALAAGAVDVIEKPDGTEPSGVWESRFLAALRIVSRIRVITHPRALLSPSATERPRVPPRGVDRERTAVDLVAIGASTGGPGALAEVLRGLPRDFTPPVLLVIHIDRPFAAAFADWLDAQSGRRVVPVRDGEPLSSVVGEARVALPDQHLVVEGRRLRLTSDPERHSCRPSVDVLFESVAREVGPSAAGCLLTGMGRDGAAGLLQMRQAGGVTIAQDEQTSVVYGMPREAALLGAAERILALSEIGPALGALPRREGKR